ncbi:MAG: hypothetical protein Q9187_008880, partial [Circinaria calcarea]
RSLCSFDSLLNLLLCMLGYLPGLLHAWYIIAKYPDPYSDEEFGGDGIGEAEYQRESGYRGQERVTRYYVARVPVPASAPAGGQGYGTTGTTGTTTTTGTGEGRQVQQQGSSRVEGQAGRREEEEEGVPPSYQEAVAGDHKVQTRD